MPRPTYVRRGRKLRPLVEMELPPAQRMCLRSHTPRRPLRLGPGQCEVHDPTARPIPFLHEDHPITRRGKAARASVLHLTKTVRAPNTIYSQPHATYVAVTTVAWDSFSKRFALARNASLMIHDSDHGNIVTTLKVPGGKITALAWSPFKRNHLAAATSGDQRVTVWDACTKSVLFRTAPTPTVVTHLCWDVMRSSILYGCGSGFLSVWEYASEQPIAHAPIPKRPLSLHSVPTGSAATRSLVVFHDARFSVVRLDFPKPALERAAASGEEKVKEDKEPKGDAEKELPKPKGLQVDVRDCNIILSDIFGEVRCCAESPEGKRVALGASSGVVVIADVMSGLPIRTLVRHGGAITSLAWSRCGEMLATGAQDHRVFVWCVDTGTCLAAPRMYSGTITHLSWARHLDRILVGTRVGLVNLLELGPVKPVSAGLEKVEAMAWCPRGKFLLSVNRENQVQLWEGGTGKLVHALTHTHTVRCVAWSSDGRLFAAGTGLGEVVIWGLSTGSIVVERCKAHVRGIECLVWSPRTRRYGNGLFLLSPTRGRDAHVWDASTLECLGRLPHDEVVTSLAFMRGEDQAAVGLRSGDIAIWNADLRRRLPSKPLRVLHGHTKHVRCLDWSPVRRELASAGEDRVVQVWDVLGNSKRELRGHSKSVRCVQWSSDGCSLASGGSDRTVVVWCVNKAVPRVTLRRHETVYACSWKPDDPTKLAIGDGIHHVGL